MTVNAVLNFEVLKRSIMHKQRDNKNNLKFLHDNMASHIAFIVGAYLAQMTVPDGPPSSL